MSDLLARAWDEAADGYEAYFVPRFAPWVDAAVAALPDLPDGPVLVPCCGTFPEAARLLARFPGREVVGIDLSAGMVRLARRRVAGLAGVRVVEGDAVALADEWVGRCAAVLSVFGLQQLPDPATGIAAWTRALQPGGRLSVMYWPADTENDGPFALVRSVLPARPEQTWEQRLVAAVEAEGGVVERDELPAFDMAHESAEVFFTAFADSGPMRATVLSQGQAFVDRVRADFLRAAPDGPWAHRPRGRLIAAVRG